MEQENKIKEKNFSARILIIAVILSLVLGTLSGGAGALLVMKNLDKFGFALGQQNGQTLVTKEKVVELNNESATIDVVKNASPSVVSIVIYRNVADISNSTSPDQEFFNQFFQFGLPFQLNPSQPANPPKNSQNQNQKQEVGSGSGFIVSSDGMIITNQHVVDDTTATYTVVTNDGQSYDAKVLGRDTVNDLAVVKIEAKNLKPLTLGDSDKIEIGQSVIAIGNTLGEYRNTVTRGVISGINRTVQAGGQGFSETLEEAIQTDAAINPGNSGGPLLNLNGEVIGINTAISQSGQLVGFAIPINEANQVITSIQKYGKIVRPYLGVRYLILNKQIAEANNLTVDYGALVAKGDTSDALAVVPGSPADKAGIVENDIILEVNGQKIDESHSLARMLSNYAPGDEVDLKIWHKGEEKTVKVKLAERSESK